MAGGRGAGSAGSSKPKVATGGCNKAVRCGRFPAATAWISRRLPEPCRSSNSASVPISPIYNQASGMANAIDVSLFVLVIGGFLGVVNATGAINTGIERVMARMQGREKWIAAAKI